VTARKAKQPRTRRRTALTPFRSAEVAALFASRPPAIQRRLLALRELIFAVAARTDGVGALEETLRWGEPAYLTSESGSGSPVRIDWRKRNPSQYAMYFQCQTSLVETFRERFPDAFSFEGNRAIVLEEADEPDERALAKCVAAALTYHRDNARKRAAEKQRVLRARR
jgi:hypothetical protein